MKVRCSEGRNESEKNRKYTGQRFRADKMDLLIFTDGPVNEERSEVQVEFVVRNITVDYSRKYMLSFSSKNTALESDLK